MVFVACDKCLDCTTVECKKCACTVCGGKHDEASQVICDECEKAFHIGCLSPPLASFPMDPEW
jgi:E3 ubiquitin-protein ligase UHRF1